MALIRVDGALTEAPRDAVPQEREGTGQRRGQGAERRTAALPTVILLLGAVYCLLPVAWVLIASTKNNAQLFNTFTFAPNGSLWSNVRRAVVLRGRRLLALDAQHGALRGRRRAAVDRGVRADRVRAGQVPSSAAGRRCSTCCSPGYSCRRWCWPLPQYLLLAKVGLTNTYWSVLLPSILSPYGIYLARIYAMSAVPDEVIESARVDGCPEGRLFARIAVPMMVPGLVTIFLFQFVAVWNNFLLPFIMLSDENKFPLTVGLYTLLNRGSSAPSLYSLVVTGSLLSIIPLIILFLALQRYWRTDIASGAVKQ